MDPGRPSAPASCAVHAPIGGNAAAPFPWLRSSAMAALSPDGREREKLQPAAQNATTEDPNSFNQQQKKFQKTNEDVGRRCTPATKAATGGLESYNRRWKSFNRKYEETDGRGTEHKKAASIKLRSFNC